MDNVPVGYCQCGCGQKTPIADRNDRSTARVKGQPMRFVRGHGRVSPTVERFTAKYAVDQETGCWVWQAARVHNGYAVLRVSGKTIYAHRWAYEHFVGPILDGLQLDHLCRNRRCVNPAHLEPVTQRENIMRGEGVSAQHGRKTHCKRGHEFTPDNTFTTKRGGRVCRTCRRAGNRIATRKYRRKLKSRQVGRMARQPDSQGIRGD